MTSTAVMHGRIKSAYWGDDAPVIQLKGKGSEHQRVVPTFGMDEWDCQDLVSRANHVVAMTNFTFGSLFADPFRRITAKELAMQRLNRPVRACKGRKRIARAKPMTIKLGLYYLVALYEFMDQENIRLLRDLTQQDLDRYARLLLAKDLPPKYVAERLSVTVWLYEARQLLTYDCITFIPWGRRPISTALGAKKDPENKTPRIPEAVMRPLLRWSLMYIDDFAPDIIAAYRRRSAIEDDLRARPSRRSTGPADTEARIREFIDERRELGLGLPGKGRSQKGVNYKKLNRYLGIGHCSHSSRKDLIDRAVQEIGIEPTTLDTPVSVPSPFKVSWREPFDAVDDLDMEGRNLTAACYIVCAYLSGMRDSEVQDIKCGRHELSRDEQGEILRHYIRSTEYKGKEDEGVERTWVVIEPVARAIKAMEQLTERAREALGTDLLFIALRWASTRRPALKDSIRRYIAEFITYVNDVLHPRCASEYLPRIPIEEFEAITTRMFRRTIAWHIANRPFGVVAGMIQYGHACETMFEGYAGSSESGFRQEVESERELARKADILGMYEDSKRGIQPSGPMAQELESEFKHIREVLGDFPGKIFNDERRREKMLEHLRVRLYPGLLADCFFDPKQARCLGSLKELDRDEPIGGICDPKCPNACWLKKHLPVWENALADTQRLAKRNRIAVIQRQILNERVKYYKDVIGQIKEERHVDSQV
jgi:hypothetical protein